MTTIPDAQIVREIVRDCVADYIDDARDIAAHVMGHFGVGVPGDVYVWTDAVRTDLRAAVVSWPDEQPQDEQEFAWHGLRLFSGPALIGDGDVEQHELTHPAQCSTLPPGAACWAERQPFRWWWPTAHGTYRIRPEDLSPLGGDGPDYQMTLRVQVLKAGEWFEYTNDVVGPDPTDETPAIVERLKVALAEKAEQPQDDGNVRAVAYPGRPGDGWRDDYEGALWVLCADGQMRMIVETEEPEDPTELDARYGPLLPLAALEARDAKGKQR